MTFLALYDKLPMTFQAYRIFKKQNESTEKGKNAKEREQPEEQYKM